MSYHHEEEHTILLITIVVLAVAAVGIFSAYQYFTPKPPEELGFFAASSLTQPFQNLQTQFESQV